GSAVGVQVVYVAPDGDDGHPGTVEQPLASLEATRDAVRAMKAAGTLPADGVVVELRGGVYRLDKAFVLTGEDSGTERAPVVYRARGGEAVVLSGGLPLTEFAPVTDEAVLARMDDGAKDRVLQAAIPEHAKGILKDLPTGFRGSASMAELFFDNRPMTLARWPNDGFVTIKKVVDAGEKSQKSDKGGVFEYDGDRPARWANAKGVYLMGYWCHDWYDVSLRIKSIDTATQQITLAKAHSYGIGGRTARRYFAFNVLEELDSPGEWYLDRDAGVLYFWPPSDVAAGNPYLTFLGEQL
ncbi:MAG: phage tail protein, partial [bacterium]|nr:phage tail protein [bacterium]